MSIRGAIPQSFPQLGTSKELKVHPVGVVVPDDGAVVDDAGGAELDVVVGADDIGADLGPDGAVPMPPGVSVNVSVGCPVLALRDRKRTTSFVKDEVTARSTFVDVTAAATSNDTSFVALDVITDDTGA